MKSQSSNTPHSRNEPLPGGRLAAAFFAAILLSLAAACAKSEAPPPVEVQVQAAFLTAAPITEHITADAVLAPAAQAAIAPKITAPVQKFYVQRGSIVKAGQLLATLENRDLTAVMHDNQGSYDAAQAAYQSTVKAQVPEDAQRAELDLAQAKANLDLNLEIVKSRKQLFAEGAIPGRDLDTAQAALVQAQGTYDAAQKHLAAMQQVSREATLKSAGGQLESAQGKYQAAQADLSYSEIRSPIAGVVTERPLYAGETAAAGTPLITVMDTATLLAKTHIAQSLAQQLKQGGPADVTVPGVDDSVPAKVSMISPALDPGSTTVEVWLTIGNRSGKLKVGTPVKLSISGHSIARAMTIPLSAVLTAENGGKTVMVVASDGTARSKPVKLGIANGEDVQVLSGLTAKDQVITSGSYGLDPGTKVKVGPAKTDDDDAAGKGGGERLMANETAAIESGGKPFWLGRSTRTIFFFAAILTVAGIYVAFQVPISVFPETNFPRVIIGVDNGVMPVEQMEVTITRPIEDAVNSVPGLENVRSTTSRGSAEVDLFFNWNVDMVLSRQLVDSALAKVQQELPPTVRITTNRLTFATFPVLGYSLTSDTVPQTRLWEMATYDLKPPLNRVDGVSSVVVQGGQEPEFHVIPNLAQLAASGVTISDLVNSIQASNIVESPGLYEANHQLILGLVGAQVHDAAGIRELVVKTTAGGAPVHVGDVATVEAATMPVYTMVTANGKNAVLLNITRQPSSNTVAVAEAVAKKVAELRHKLPPDVKLELFYDQSQLVRDSIGSVRDAIFIGLILACVILFLFLRDWTSSLVAGLVIPVTISVTILALWLIGESFNLMTLGGLAAAIGLVIDDAIVVVENVVMHRDLGEHRAEAVRKALGELTVPLIGSTITPVVVFLPLISVSGVTGAFFRALAITMAAALITSLALALTWTPGLSYVLLREDRERAARHAGQGPVLRRLLEGHSRALEWVLAKPLWTTGICVLLVIGTWAGYQALGSDLLPRMDEGGFILDYIMPAGSSLSETNRVLEDVTRILHAIPEVENTSRRTGLQLGLAAVTEANSGDFTVKLKAKRDRSVWDVMDEVRDRVKAAEPELDIELTQVLEDNINDLSNAPEPIQVKIFSDDAKLLNQLGPRVEDAISKIPGVVDAENGVENTISGPATNFEVDPVLAARLGFTPTEVSNDATAILDGITTTPLISNGRQYPIRIRLAGDTRKSLDSIEDTVFNSSSGHTASLGSLAAVTELPPQNEILRENLQRLIVVTGDMEGADLGGVMAKIQQTVAGMHLPPTVRVEYGGTYQEQQKSFRDLLRVLLLALVLVFGVLLAEFRNFPAPIAILTSSVLSISGVILALLLTGTTFNVASFMGLIMVIGIVAKNGILLLDADEKFRAAGMSPRTAMLEAAQRRLRPILMTALAAMTGMLPLALALGAGSQMLQPLAIAVIGGLLISMALSLIVTPAVYYFLTRTRSEIPAETANVPA